MEGDIFFLQLPNKRKTVQERNDIFVLSPSSLIAQEMTCLSRNTLI